jgi:hypothetical protein
VDVQFSGHLLKEKEAVFSPSCVLGSFLKDQLYIYIYVYVYIYIYIYTYVCVCVCVYLCLDLLFWSIELPICFCANTMLFLFCYGSVVYFEVRYCDVSSIVHFAQNCFGYSRSFVFSYIFQDWFFYFCAECHCNLIGIALNM